MNYILKFQEKGDGKGTVEIYKKTDDGEKHMGGIFFKNDADRKWIIEVLHENHPNVTIEE